uniref:Uncharacterized protein n=1 Tax=Rhizophora mucronata TaxID=61149 RepID=A0A2P2N832_RHIMU
MSLYSAYQLFLYKSMHLLHSEF